MVRGSKETQLTPQWTKKLNTRVTFTRISIGAKHANIKMVKELIKETIFPKQVSPMLAHSQITGKQLITTTDTKKEITLNNSYQKTNHGTEKQSKGKTSGPKNGQKEQT